MARAPGLPPRPSLTLDRPLGKLPPSRASPGLTDIWCPSRSNATSLLSGTLALQVPSASYGTQSLGSNL